MHRTTEEYFAVSLREGESLVSLDGQHWTRFSLTIALLLVLFLLPFFFLWPLFKLGTFGVATFFSIVVVAIILLFREYYKWRYTVLIATSQRVIVIEKRAFFSKRMVEIPLSFISSVEEETKGFWQTILRYGTVIVRAKDRSESIHFRHVGHPRDLCAELRNLRDELQTTKAAATGEWWWDRFISLSTEEQRQLLEMVHRYLNEDEWRELFRPQAKNKE
ncbi:hypothetical protein COV04_00640 [Candidatus Uhrbacteria bacterium CG10_big_fil_rev_8_21_14_0_10_48_11]|uniref:YdbS-like PH domain-containing protein n=1 Tax=Candidatus Uhrbacteria bacterium CG10_big_fil_rev_8_21_14_0_10_48_11 TaxID=1975037 RepID=A0A2M8LFK9_9BACT|nr:MAG: hypothetical protein COV04_00640 [Candidatus Uhrbacteria bacterium CG10_big_fil_rev_8_21_14_0_10_48_11]